MTSLIAKTINYNLNFILNLLILHNRASLYVVEECLRVVLIFNHIKNRHNYADSWPILDVNPVHLKHTNKIRRCVVQGGMVRGGVGRGGVVRGSGVWGGEVVWSRWCGARWCGARWCGAKWCGARRRGRGGEHDVHPGRPSGNVMVWTKYEIKWNITIKFLPFFIFVSVTYDHYRTLDKQHLVFNSVIFIENLNSVCSFTSNVGWHFPETGL